MSSTRFRSALADGLYEDVISTALDTSLSSLHPSAIAREPLDLDDSVEPLTDEIEHAARRALTALRGKQALDSRIALANEVLQVLRRHSPEAFREGEAQLRPEMLLHIARSTALHTEGRVPPRPVTPLRRSELFVNAERQSIVRELLSEIESADRIDLIVAFIRWSGFVKFRDALAAHCRRNRPLRVLTTTYLGATDARAVEELCALGAAVRVSYEETPTRLHAKAWLFHRDSGHTTAYVGSSNLSRAALTDGIEWNVRVSVSDVPQVIERFEGVFTRYWDDRGSGFQPYDGSPEHRARLHEALVRAKGERTGRSVDPRRYVVDVLPRDFQRQILEDLEVARRVRGHHRNLVVAATGTGKTVVAALDYQRLRRDGIDSLLFVAHRERILDQSRETFRAVLKDPGFGEMYVAGERPRVGTHVFASIQSLVGAVEKGLAPDAFDMVIVDEVHHAAADTYAKLLRALQPKELLGLTATPERTDDLPGERLQLEAFFDTPWASELRVWEAIDRQILVPFNYFAIDDGTDVREAWSRGRYVPSALSNVYDANRIWVRHAARAVARYVRDAGSMRAVAFCANIAHARLAAVELAKAIGVSCAVITNEESADERDRVLRAFEGAADDRPRILCVVDLLNEGVDIPAIDTLLLLRPTESATLFLQQLGRGLRRAHGKDALTVLDFVGMQHDRFRFELRYRALLGSSAREVRELVDSGFGHLPAGCSIQLEEKPREQILAALKRSLRLDVDSIASRLQRGDESLSLDAFLEREGLEPAQLYRKHGTWSALRERAGYAVPRVADAEEGEALGNVERFLHVDDPWRLATLDRLCKGGVRLPDDEHERRLLRMIFVVLYGTEVGSDVERTLARWSTHARLRAEIAAVLPVLRKRSRVVTAPTTRLGREIPLHLHGRFLTEEIMAAFLPAEQPVYRPQGGVIKRDPFDLLLVTLDKASKSKVPHLQYQDYALGPRLFHWQSVASTTRDSTMGRRHLDRSVVPLLFVREVNKDERGLAVGYRFLGAGKRKEDHGERPMTVVWELTDAEMPADLLVRSRVAVS